jgi:precorrin-6A synthase
MRRILAIGIGTGHPEQLTVQATRALNQLDVVFLLDKGSEKADLGALRRQLCERYIEQRAVRFVELTDSARDANAPSYAQAVEEWHARRLQLYERAIADELAEDGCGGILVWGDPSLYDSTLRLLEQMQARARVSFKYEVIPGISSPQLLAARHKITLNRIGGAVHITTGRRVGEVVPTESVDVVVMLDGDCSFRNLSDPQLEIYWGAYLGSEHELLIAGPLERCKDEIQRVRSAARARHGWIMDTYLLRKKPAP